MKNSLLSLNNKFQKDHALKLFYLTLFLIPLKLSLTYLVFLPLLISTVIYLLNNQILVEITQSNRGLVASWLFLVVALVVFSLFGFDPLHSLRGILELFCYSLAVPVFAYYLSNEKGKFPQAICFLLAGQGVAAAYSLLEFYQPETFSQIFIGTVSESGQLCLTIFLSLAAVITFKQNDFDKQHPKRFLLSLVLLFCLFLALLVNLKRGPWLGFTVGGIIFFMFYRPKIILFFVLAIVLPILISPALQERIFASVNHFFINGGRYDIWQLGLDLVAKNPLGIGYANSRELVNYSVVIPGNLTHFHSNFINFLVEGGALTCLLFISLCFQLLKVGLRNYQESCRAGQQDILQLAIVCGLIAWLTAGVVEYNFGDSEVMLIVYFFVANIFASNYGLLKKLIN